MSDYRQPDFYRFTEDSLLLVKVVCESISTASQILDIGAGSGVIGCELVRKLGASEVHFLELQREWEPILLENMKRFIPEVRSMIYWGSVSEWQTSNKYDLIVSNPPYFLPGEGKLSPDPVRARCRSFLEDGWRILGQKTQSALRPGGSAWFVTLAENLPHIEREWSGVIFERMLRGKLIILRINSPE